MNMLKRFFILGVFSVVFSLSSFAQRVAIVDVGSILENLDEYKNAQIELDKVAKQWRQVIIKEQDKVKALYNEYEAEAVLMTEEMKKNKEAEIVKKEKEIREMQRGYFGPEGELFQKRQELVQPIEDRVYSEITGFAEDKGFDIVIDKSSGQGVLFVGERYDQTEAIKKRLGIK